MWGFPIRSGRYVTPDIRYSCELSPSMTVSTAYSQIAHAMIVSIVKISPPRVLWSTFEGPASTGKPLYQKISWIMRTHPCSREALQLMRNYHLTHYLQSWPSSRLFQLLGIRNKEIVPQTLWSNSQIFVGDEQMHTVKSPYRPCDDLRQVLRVFSIWSSITISDILQLEKFRIIRFWMSAVK